MAERISGHNTWVDGHRIAYREQGEGKPLILLHGIPTNSLLWRDIIPPLAVSRRVIAPDLLNYGTSDFPLTADVSINAQCQIILGFMNALGIRRADIAGHDIGGGIAQLLAVKYPERVDRLVLMDSVCFDSWPIPEFAALQRTGVEEAMSLGELTTMLRDFIPDGVHDQELVTPELKDLYVKPWSTDAGKRAFFRNVRRLNPEYTLAIADDLELLPHPTLILWGENDHFQQPEYAEQLATVIPNSQLTWVSAAAHWLTEDQPQAICDHINRFLD